jgi:hypothetical protein|tara:strand:- start:760 stop:1344 length:585 start_codon:yes stop_codon:yes gene_type:complete
MADGLSIFRPATEVEKADYVDISKGYHGLMDKFLAALVKKATEYQKRFQPYDSYSARMDFEDDMQRYINQASSVIPGQALKALKDIDLDKYGNAARFELVSIETVKEDKLLDGIRNTVTTGYYYNFKAIERGNGISLFVPMSDVPELNAVPLIEKWLKDNGFGKPNPLTGEIEKPEEKEEVVEKKVEETKGKTK